MAQFRFICIADVIPPNNTTLVLSSSCPGGSGWIEDTQWLEPLSYTEGFELASAIVLVWIAGWGARQVIRVIRR